MHPTSNKFEEHLKQRAGAEALYTDEYRQVPKFFMETTSREHFAPTLPYAKVVVVDDDSGIRDYIKKALRTEKIEAVTFSSPLQAMIALTESGSQVDAVISDIEMPEMNGLSFAADVVSRFPNMPILMISGKRGYESRAGQWSLLQKPFGRDALMRALDGVMHPH